MNRLRNLRRNRRHFEQPRSDLFLGPVKAASTGGLKQPAILGSLDRIARNRYASIKGRPSSPIEPTKNSFEYENSDKPNKFNEKFEENPNKLEILNDEECEEEDVVTMKAPVPITDEIQEVQVGGGIDDEICEEEEQNFPEVVTEALMNNAQTESECVEDDVTENKNT